MDRKILDNSVRLMKVYLYLTPMHYITVSKKMVKTLFIIIIKNTLTVWYHFVIPRTVTDDSNTFKGLPIINIYI